jgi:cell division protein FtsW (lipid II flippase)
MLYVATERPGWLVVGVTMFVVGSYLVYVFVAHVRERFLLWSDVWAHYGGNTDDKGRQTVETMFGMAYGGLIGRGLGQGSPWRIPFAQSDFIFGAIGEELGLTGSIAVILLYGLIVERALRAALISRDDIGKLLATGLGGAVALQVFVVVGGVTHLIPRTGLTTPFLSYGGSSLVANWVIVAILLRISDAARRPPPDLSLPDDAAMDETQVVKMQ